MIRMSLVLAVLCCCMEAFAAQVVVIGNPVSRSPDRLQVEEAAAFYGLNMKISAPQKGAQFETLLDALRDSSTVAVVVDADVLAALEPKQVLGSLQRSQGRIPLMIAGINQNTPPALLRLWSSGAVTGCGGSISWKRADGMRWFRAAKLQRHSEARGSRLAGRIRRL